MASWSVELKRGVGGRGGALRGGWRVNLSALMSEAAYSGLNVVWGG